MSGINLVGDRAMRIMDLLRVRRLQASPVTIPFKAQSYCCIRLFRISSCFCIEINASGNIVIFVFLRFKQLNPVFASESFYTEITAAFRAVHPACAVNVEKHGKNIGAVAAEHQCVVISIQIKNQSVIHTKSRSLNNTYGS